MHDVSKFLKKFPNFKKFHTKQNIKLKNFYKTGNVYKISTNRVF